MPCFQRSSMLRSQNMDQAKLFDRLLPILGEREGCDAVANFGTYVGLIRPFENRLVHRVTTVSSCSQTSEREQLFLIRRRRRQSMSELQLAFGYRASLIRTDAEHSANVLDGHSATNQCLTLVAVVANRLFKPSVDACVRRCKYTSMPMSGRMATFSVSASVCCPTMA